MSKPNCPKCKSSEIEDTSVGWKCRNCTGSVFSEYQDEKGIVHRYTDLGQQQQRMFDETHIYDMDAMDTMVGVTEPGGVTYNVSLAKLAQLASELDEKGYKKEADIIDQFLEVNKDKARLEPYEQVQPVKYLSPNKMHDKPDLKFIPYDDIYSLSGEPLANL